MTVKIGINGYGTIGKRVALAVREQKDMEIVGVSKTRPTYEAWHAKERGFRLFTPKEKMNDFEDKGLDVYGTLEDLYGLSDVVVDCTPGKVGATYLDDYKEAKVKAMFQGGEKHATTGVSFNAYSSYEGSIGEDYVRVVSCNTTGLTRTLYPLHAEGYIDKVIATMIRRSADPWDSKKGPINAITPELKVPSHHGPDVITVIPNLDISTVAVKVPTTIMHLHANQVFLKKEISVEEVLDMWDGYGRVKLLEGWKGISSTAQVMEYARNLGRPFSDLYEIAVWSDGVHIDNGVLYYFQAVHQESDVVPENIDCIRAMMNLEDDPWASIEETDRTLGIPGGE